MIDSNEISDKIKNFHIDYIEHPIGNKDLRELVIRSDKDFVPPLSFRQTTFQKELKEIEVREEREDKLPLEYYRQLLNQSMLICKSGKQLIGFMSIKKNFRNKVISEESFPNIYITTIIVNKEFRNLGITRRLYKELFEGFRQYKIFTRTWSTNDVHIHILKSLGFLEIKRIKWDRGKDIDTVYFFKEN